MQPEKDWAEKAAEEIMGDGQPWSPSFYDPEGFKIRAVEIIKRHAEDARPRLGAGDLLTQKTVMGLASPEDTNKILRKIQQMTAKGRARLQRPKRDREAFEELYHRYYGFPKVGEGTPNHGPCYRVAKDIWEGALKYARRTR